MSNTVDGFWKAGFWGSVFWAEGFWQEPPAEVLGGGWKHVKDYRRTDDDISKARSEYGIAFDVIETVAKRQSENLLTDEQKIYDELAGELKLTGLEMESRHLEALNYQREQLINAEIGKLLRIKLEDEEAFMMLMAMII